MSARFLLDTNVLSEPLKPRPSPAVLARLAEHDGHLATAAIVLHELWFGARRLPASARRRAIERYLEDVVARTLPILAYDGAAARLHAAERARLKDEGRTPAFVDGQIAAIAVQHGLTLVTRNGADFEGFAGLLVEDWHG